MPVLLSDFQQCHSDSRSLLIYRQGQNGFRTRNLTDNRREERTQQRKGRPRVEIRCWNEVPGAEVRNLEPGI